MMSFVGLLLAFCASWIQVGSPTAAALHSVAWTGSSFLAVGDSGTILSSTDGSAWTREESGTRLNLKIAKGNDTVRVVGGDSGSILVSRRGSAWTLSRTSDSQAVCGLAIGPRTTLVSHVGAPNLWSGTIDSAWHGAPSPSVGSFLGMRIRSIAWNKTEFVAVGNSNLLYTGDSSGLSWGAATTGSSGMDALACDSAGCYATTSAFDGTTGSGIRGIRWWDRFVYSVSADRPSNSRYRAIDANQGLRLAVGDSGLVVRWTNSDSKGRKDSVPVHANLAGIAIGKDAAAAVGDGGTTLLERSLTSSIVAVRTSGAPRSGRSLAMSRIIELEAPGAGAWLLEIIDIRGRILARRRILAPADGRKVRIPFADATLIDYRFKPIPE